ncbi:Tn3 family transposase, partial [Enterobacter hormaechei]
MNKTKGCLIANFATVPLLGFRFAPRIRDLGDTKLYIPKGDA